MHSYSISESSSLNKNAHNKYLIIPLVFIIVFTSFFSSVNQAKANPLALSGGITIGAGAYTLAALGLAGIVGLAGYEEYEQEINAHAMRAWQNGSDLAKTSITMSLEAAKGLGNGLVNLEEPFLNWANTQIDSLAAAINTKTIRDATVHTDYVVSYPLDRQVSIAFTSESGLSLNGASTPILNVNGNGYVQLAYSVREFKDFPYNMTYQIAVDQLTRVTDLSSMMALAQSWGLDAVLEKDGYSPAVYKQRIQESWESMRDAGLVLPVDSAIPHANGKQATYNPDTDTYTGVDGGVINPSDVTWSFPMPRVRTNDVPVPGVYVDTPPLTGVPSIDEAIAKNPAIPKTTTNVNTGVTIANPDYPLEGNPPIEGEIPGGQVPPTTPPKPGPGTQPILPVAILLALFDLLRAILMYLSRMFAFLVTIPFVTSIPIDNPYFQWFRTATILGVQPYPLVMTTAAFFMSFAAYKSIRRLLP